MIDNNNHSEQQQQQRPISILQAVEANQIGIEEELAVALITLAIPKVRDYYGNSQMDFLDANLECLCIYPNGSVEFTCHESKCNSQSTINGHDAAKPADNSGDKSIQKFKAFFIDFLNHFGDMIYKALDFGVSQENERELSEGIERIILHLCGECLSDLAGEEVLKKKHELNNKKAIQSYLKKLENLLEDFRTEYCQLNEIVSFNPEEIVAKYYNLCRETLKIADVINYKKQGFSKISQNQEQTAQKIPNHIDELLKQSQKETNGKANKKIDTLSNNDKDSDKLKDPVEIENEGGGDVLDNNALIADDTKVQPTSLHSSLEDMLNKLKGASSDNANNSGSLAPENNDFSELKAIGDDNQITDSRNVDEKPRLEGMKIIKLTKICITMISAEFDAYNASTEFLNVLIDGRLCIICHGPTASNSEDRCIVCGFNSCPRHCSTVLIPEKPFLRDNMVHDFTEELPEGHQICPKSASINYSSYISNCLTANHYTYVVICEKCKDLSFGIKHEYLRESRS